MGRKLSFDWITARQVVGHFYDPLLVFENWHRWLKAGGRVLIVARKREGKEFPA
jgi:hypothetical protein